MADASVLKALEEIPGVYVARKGALRCTAFVLKNGGVCLFSPVAGLSGAIKQDLKDIGPLESVLAPNHYHNKALAEFKKAFPKAKFCAPEPARARIEKVSGVKLTSMEDVVAQLPKYLTVLEPDGLKTGEVWIKSALKKRVSWFVVDAFSGEKMTAKKDCGRAAALLKTFPTYGIQDKGLYATWLKRQLAKDKPTLLVPCHGTIIANDKLSADMTKLVSQI